MRTKNFYVQNPLHSMMIIIIVIFLVSLVFMITVKANIEKEEDIRYVEVHIKYGDTLWNLAKQFTPKNKDVRKTLHEISIINEMNSLEIYPGQIIKIPIE
ncbi:cell division suppressor protein YneA [Inediibacterium massiliense]|uniref:cell division suppressor protein YneA n=1 Tax=Inediibacterium massiliense TaxID=1658111 RepID=UPI0006B57568|nr:LysM peptidoglycan-binding domain-containing protein [Inediibacterium massiliense]